MVCVQYLLDRYILILCTGRRVAELELHIALSQLIRTFGVEFKDDKPMDYVQNLFLMPERRFDLVFIDL